MTLRKIFNWDNIDESKIVNWGKRDEFYANPVSAAGCLFYKEINGKKKLLLIKYDDSGWPKLDDLGGKVDDVDATIYDTIARETMEESNHVISYEFMKNMCESKQYIPFYSRHSNYYCIVVKVNDDFFPNTNVFGNLELTDNIRRTVAWVDYPECKNDLAHRIGKNYNLVNYLDRESHNNPKR